MPSSSEYTAYQSVIDRVLTGAEDDLAAVIRSLSSVRDIVTIREQLKLVMPALVDTYGPALTEGLLQWYDEVRPSTVSSYRPRALSGGDLSQTIDRTAHYTAGFLSTDTGKAARVLGGTMGRMIQTGPRRTMLMAADLDPSSPRFARIQVGKTCAWCSMLASRGWVYSSRGLAGGAGHEFHSHCDCQIIPDWLHKGVHGYDPDDLYSKYLLARRRAINAGYTRPDASTIASYMRRTHPDAYTDGEGVVRSSKTLRSKALEDLAQQSPTNGENNA